MFLDCKEEEKMIPLQKPTTHQTAAAGRNLHIEFFATKKIF